MEKTAAVKFQIIFPNLYTLSEGKIWKNQSFPNLYRVSGTKIWKRTILTKKAEYAQNAIIVGSPAKIVRREIRWER